MLLSRLPRLRPREQSKAKGAKDKAGSDDGADGRTFSPTTVRSRSCRPRSSEDGGDQEAPVEVGNLKDELSLTKEHSAGLVENLENATRELSDLRAMPSPVKTHSSGDSSWKLAMWRSRPLGASDKAPTRLKEVESELEGHREGSVDRQEHESQPAASRARNAELEAEVSKDYGSEGFS